jgi:hypothetical protein
LAALAAAVLAGLTLSTLDVTPAAAAGDAGYVRLAHLSPDTPEVDVYFSSPTNAIPPKKIPGVGYGVVSDYLTVPAGTYAVAMRGAGAAESTPPVLTTQVNVVAGRAYTVAGVGRHADLGLRVINDDITPPDNGKAKVRVVQASIKAPILDVSVASGATIATGAAFASTTDYREVNQGKWTVTLKQAGGTAASTVQCMLASGNVYSLFVLDRPAGLTAELRTDAASTGNIVPQGAVETGAGGGMRRDATPLAVAVMFLALLALSRVRRTAR